MPRNTFVSIPRDQYDAMVYVIDRARAQLDALDGVHHSLKALDDIRSAPAHGNVARTISRAEIVVVET